MSDETKAAMAELNAIRLDIFRAAADLDRNIRDIELTLDDPAGPEFIKMFAVNEKNLREDVIRICGYDKLIAREKEAWQKLIASL